MSHPEHMVAEDHPEAAVVSVPYDADVVQTLVQEMADDLAQHYGPASYPPQDPLDWTAPDGGMFVLLVGGEPAGCGGFTRHDDMTAEIKRMFVHPAHRRNGFGKILLAAIEKEALRLGYQRMTLETGLPQQAARALYEASGYRPAPCWPPYDRDPTSVCFSRKLEGSNGQ